MAEKKKSTVEVVWEIAEPLAQELGLILWDIRFLKEGADWILRVIIDKEEAPVDMEDCVAMSHALDLPLDEKDPISQSYSLQVQSPGIERELTRDFHFECFLGAPVMVKFIHEKDGIKEAKGTLQAYEKGKVSITLSDGTVLEFDKKETSYVKLDDFGGF